MADPQTGSDALSFKADRFGGIVAEVTGVVQPSAGKAVPSFEESLDSFLATWSEQGKRGVWIKVPNRHALSIPVLLARGFDWHHAKPGYCLLNRWLASSESKLPRYPCTQVGVGGFVVNGRGEVLLVQERVSAVAAAQGQWKLPGGVADPGEELSETAAREVKEETGIDCALESVASFRHSHGYAHGMDDIYFVLRMRASTETINFDPEEIGAAEWMSREKVDALHAEGLINESNKRTFDLCFDESRAITAMKVPSVRGGHSLWYMVPPKASL